MMHCLLKCTETIQWHNDKQMSSYKFLTGVKISDCSYNIIYVHTKQSLSIYFVNEFLVSFFQMLGPLVVGHHSRHLCCFRSQRLGLGLCILILSFAAPQA